MKTRMAILLSCLISTQAWAYPISYLFSGSTISMTNTSGGETTNFDVNSPLVINGQTLLNGDIELIGRVTFDSELLNVQSYPSPFAIEDLIKSISFKMETEGLIFSGKGSMVAPVWEYSNNTIKFHLEAFGSSVADRMNFTLNLTDLTGMVDFSDFGLMTGGKLTANIDQAFLMAPTVPLPGSMILLASALFVLDSRRSRQRRT